MKYNRFQISMFSYVMYTQNGLPRAPEAALRHGRFPKLGGWLAHVEFRLRWRQPNPFNGSNAADDHKAANTMDTISTGVPPASEDTVDTWNWKQKVLKVRIRLVRRRNGR